MYDVLSSVTNHIEFTKTGSGFVQCTEVRFDSLLSGRFTSMKVINQPEKSGKSHLWAVQCKRFMKYERSGSRYGSDVPTGY